MTIKKIHTFWEDTAKVWLHEHLEMFRDEGALLFVILLPLAYPLLYSWIYNNEVVREVPVAVVDCSNSATSREFVRHVDASPDGWEAEVLQVSSPVFLLQSHLLLSLTEPVRFL